MATVVVGIALLALVIGLRLRSRLAATSANATTDPEIVDSLWPFVRPYRHVLVFSTGLTLLLTLVELASPWPFKVLVDNAIGGDPLPSWLGFLNDLGPSGLAAAAVISSAALVLVAAVLSYLASILIGSVEVRIGADIRAAAFHRLQFVSLRFHDANRTGDLVSRLHTDTSRARDLLVAWFDRIVPEALTMIGMVVIMLWVDVQLTLVALAVVPFITFYAVHKRPVIRAAHRRARDSRGVVASHATDVLRNVRAVQAFSRQGTEVTRFQRRNTVAADDAIAALDIAARYRPVAGILLAFGSGLVAWVGALKVISGELSLGTLLVMLAYVGSLYGPIRSLSRLASTFAKGAASRERLMEVLADEHIVPESQDPVPAPIKPRFLVAKHINFSYRADTPVLKDFGLTIGRGESICIVGPTGAGKSTILSVLLRLYDAESGTIEMDGVDTRQMTLRSLRDRLAVVPQDPWILDGTIAENIAFGKPGATAADVERAARLAHVEEFVNRFPDGYGTVVGEGGELLSGGQRRRVALARALIREAPVLLLDEPTSGLDAKSESDVIRAIESAQRGRMTILVSHRLNIARSADWVVVLENGAVVERGAPEQLLESGGHFATLWSLQHSSDAASSADESEERSVESDMNGEGGDVNGHERIVGRHVQVRRPSRPRLEQQLQQQLEQLE